VLLHLMAGSKEHAETVVAFFEDMKMRGLMKDKAAHACHALCRARVVEEIQRRKEHRTQTT